MAGLPMLVLLLAIVGTCYAQDFNITATLDKLSQNHDKRIRASWGGPAVDVGITMYFLQIFDISTKEQKVKADFYWRQTWNDPRLKFDAPAEIDFITLGQEGSQMFWAPDTFIPNAQHMTLHDENVFWKIKKNGTVMKSVRVLTKHALEMDLRYFPFDHQIFTMQMESYGYSAKDVDYNWQRGKESVGISHEAGSQEFNVEKHRQKALTIFLTTGNYSVLQVDIYMTRNSGHYMTHFYLPSIISFILVWASFWFSPEHTVIRVLLMLSAFLSGNFLLSRAWDHLPSLDYSTKLEKYIVFGLIMALVAVGECVVVVLLERRAQKIKIKRPDAESNHLDDETKKQTAKKLESDIDDEKEAGSYLSRSTRYIMTIHKHRRSYHKVDVFFRILYPIIFIIYNICYWMSFP